MFEAVDRVMKNKRGGAVPRRTQIGGQDHMLSYITPTEAEILMQLGGSGEPGPAGIPAFPDYGDDTGFGGSGGGEAATGGGFGDGDKGGGDNQPGDDFDPLAGTQTYDAATGELTSFDATPGTGDYGGYEDDDFGFAQPGSTTGVIGAQQSYNMANAITLDNPYGNKGFFTRVFGIPANKISYSNIMSANTRAQIANNQFSKFANPTNQPGKIGYNPAFPTAKPGFLRPGVQKAGFNTALGPVQEFATKRSPTDMLAIAGIGALNPAFGLLAESLTDTTYGLKGMPPPDAAPPGEPQTFMGQAFQAGKQAIGDFYDAAKEAIGDLADFLSPEQAQAVATATPAEQEQIKAELQGPPQLTQDVTQGLNQTNVTTQLDFPGTASDYMSQMSQSVTGSLTGKTPAEMQQEAIAKGFAAYNTAPTSSLADIQAQAAQDAQSLGLASLGTPDELSGVPMSGTVASTTLGSLVDALPDAPSLDMQSIPGFTQDALTSAGGQGPFFGGDGPDRPTQEETEGDEDPYSYDPKITGGYYDYGQPPTFDDRILIPTEEVLKDRFNIVIPPVFSIDPL